MSHPDTPLLRQLHAASPPPEAGQPADSPLFEEILKEVDAESEIHPPERFFARPTERAEKALRACERVLLRLYGAPALFADVLTEAEREARGERYRRAVVSEWRDFADILGFRPNVAMLFTKENVLVAVCHATFSINFRTETEQLPSSRLFPESARKLVARQTSAEWHLEQAEVRADLLLHVHHGRVPVHCVSNHLLHDASAAQTQMAGEAYLTRYGILPARFGMDLWLTSRGAVVASDNTPAGLRRD